MLLKQNGEHLWHILGREVQLPSRWPVRTNELEVEEHFWQ